MKRILIPTLGISLLMALVTVSGSAFAANVKVAIGTGQNGQFTCDDGLNTRVSIDRWSFGLNKAKGGLFGNLDATNQIVGQLFINFNSGTITENKFTASGVGSNGLCSGSFSSVSGTIKGKCGFGDIQVITSDGSGTLSGTVACNN